MTLKESISSCKALVCILLLASIGNLIYAQQPARSVSTIPLLKDEYWYGGAVDEAISAPFKEGYCIDLNSNTKGNQAMPFFVSTAGRYLWSEAPFSFHIKNRVIHIAKNAAPVALGTGGNSLQNGYKVAAAKYFPATGAMPDSLLFLKPQYNTWIELLYNQQQDSILNYAKAIIKNGYPAGVLMIDDNWFSHYGDLRFRKDRFSNAKKMVDELHQMGFKVMVWVCPFISPDTEIFRELKAKKLLIYDNHGNSTVTWTTAEDPLIVKWWNGHSAQIDLTNPEAVSWFKARLTYVTEEYGIDGFKFDAGDPEFYPSSMVTYKKSTANDMCERWGTFGLQYPLNEYRAMWKRGGQPLAERLRDKLHTWEDLQKLIPGITTAGILGYPFVCPDMIGGGDYQSFINDSKFDQDLIVRSAQCQALMPMMQFSVAPWRILDAARQQAVLQAVQLREQLMPYIFSLVLNAKRDGTPIVTSMEYSYPYKGYSNLKGQFLLGDKYLVAPVLSKDNVKKVYFPDGNWKDQKGNIINGPIVKEIAVDIYSLPLFELID